MKDFHLRLHISGYKLQSRSSYLSRGEETKEGATIVEHLSLLSALLSKWILECMPKPPDNRRECRNAYFDLGASSLKAGISMPYKGQ